MIRTRRSSSALRRIPRGCIRRCTARAGRSRPKARTSVTAARGGIGGESTSRPRARLAKPDAARIILYGVVADGGRCEEAHGPTRASLS